MGSKIKLHSKVNPIFHVIYFELTLNIKKFIIFLVVEILTLFWFRYGEIYLNPTSLLGSQIGFYINGMRYFYLILIFAITFSFSSIICSEFKNKTGLTVLPLISSNKLIIGKYLANLISIIGLTIVYYIFLILLGYNFFGEPIYYRLILSLGFCLLFILAFSSLITFLSSFMPSAASIIILSGFFLFYFEIIINYSFMEMTSLEPLYSFTYLFEIIPVIINPTFPQYRYSIIETGDTIYNLWYFPSSGGAFIMLSLYSIIFFLLASIIFKRKELKK